MLSLAAAFTSSAERTQGRLTSGAASIYYIPFVKKVSIWIPLSINWPQWIALKIMAFTPTLTLVLSI